jgi:hypothetical protein
MSSLHRAPLCAALLLTAWALAGAALAQRPPLPKGDWGKRGPNQAEPKSWEGEGTVEAVQGGAVKLTSSRQELWIAKTVPGQSKVLVEGTAEPDFLRPGLSVKLSGTIDKKGTLDGEIAALEIFSPHGKGDIGLFLSGEDKPARNPGPGTYDIRGKVASFKEGLLTVTAGGKRITGKLADAAEIKVNLDQLSFAQQGDAIRVKLWFAEGAGPNPQQQRPGDAVAEEITITLAKPLTGTKKPAPRTTRASRPAATAPAEEKTPAARDDGFGAGAPKLEDLDQQK